MIFFIDTAPDTAVQASEHQRLLGYPRERALDERARALARGAREWYAEHGRPWVYAREAASLELVGEEGVAIEGVRFTSPRLHGTLAAAGADRVVLVALSAGPELEREAQRLWREGRPDESFFLDAYGSAVVEHLATSTGARLCAAADELGQAVLPHYSPGYPGWDMTGQHRLLELIAGAAALPGPLEALESGMLRPQKSLLAVFGLTSHTERVRPLTELVPCESCTLPGCGFRRAPYREPFPGLTRAEIT